MLVTTLGGLMASVSLSPTAESQQARCSIAPSPYQPEEPLELNHVDNGYLSKTLVMEKEVFLCRTQSGDIGQMRDVETFIELVEDVDRKGNVRLVEASLQVAQCTKDFTSGAVTCVLSEPDRRIERRNPPLGDPGDCRPHEDPDLQPRDPVEMETLIYTEHRAKTVKVEKEVLLCEGAIVDLYLFTEIFEATKKTPKRPEDPDILRRKLSWRPLGHRFYGIVCTKTTPGNELGTVHTDNCFEFDPGVAT